MVFRVKASNEDGDGEEEHSRLLSPSSDYARYDGGPDEDLPKR